MSKLKGYEQQIYQEYKGGKTSQEKLAKKYAKIIKQPVSRAAIGKVVHKIEKKFTEVAEVNTEINNKKNELQLFNTQKERMEIIETFKDYLKNHKEAEEEDEVIQLCKDILYALREYEGGEKVQAVFYQDNRQVNIVQITREVASDLWEHMEDCLGMAAKNKFQAYLNDVLPAKAKD